MAFQTDIQRPALCRSSAVVIGYLAEAVRAVCPVRCRHSCLIQSDLLAVFAVLDFPELVVYCVPMSRLRYAPTMIMSRGGASLNSNVYSSLRSWINNG